MFQVLSVLIGMYVLTRMLEVIEEREAAKRRGANYYFAILTALAALMAIIYFIFSPTLPGIGAQDLWK